MGGLLERRLREVSTAFSISVVRQSGGAVAGFPRIPIKKKIDVVSFSGIVYRCPPIADFHSEDQITPFL
ncbi:MAG TPA: hypothetical protein DEB39_08840 [Planctomycetaceae bacterium]|nr:hypothetical protein [Planctomycetaceae bacterium]